MSGTHTPGPWLVNTHTREVFTSDDRTIARAHLDSRKRSIEESVANARLIAAAPDLLEAASDVLTYMDLCGDKGDLERNLRAAIAKARGQS